MSLNNDIEQDSDLVHEVLQRCARRRIMPIVEEICIEHGVTPRELVSRQRSKLFNTARQHLWTELYQTGRLSYPDIGWIFLRDHSTIISGVMKHRSSPRAKIYMSCTGQCQEASCA